MHLHRLVIKQRSLLIEQASLLYRSTKQEDEETPYLA